MNHIRFVIQQQHKKNLLKFTTEEERMCYRDLMKKWKLQGIRMQQPERRVWNWSKLYHPLIKPSGANVGKELLKMLRDPVWIGIKHE